MPATATMAPEVLSDPIGVVVDLVCAADPALDRAMVEAVVAGIAGGRAKRRRLARALLDRPTLLADGRSPAPRVVADLLIALRKAGAEQISPPVCATCGKPLRTLQRRGQDWYCAVCGPRPRRCAACGQDRIIASIDRQGRPRCGGCPDQDGPDPLVVLVAVVTRLDPSLPASAVDAAARRVFARPAKLRQLAWVVEDRPELLTGAGAKAPIPAVLRLIDELCRAGAQTITRPACPRCRRVIGLHRRVGGQWLCRSCVAKSRAQPCSRCGTVREAATRDPHGRPLCPNCLITDPANQGTCVGCGRRRPVCARTVDGPRCQTCQSPPTMTCSICGRLAPCWISKTTGQPWCQACQQRWARCCGCGKVQPVRGGSHAEPLCARCTRPDPSFWRACPTCGKTAQLRPGPCTRCVVDRRLRALLSDEHGQLRPELAGLRRSLAGTERPDTVLRWLDRPTGPAMLRELAIGARPLSHAALDRLPDSKPREHLRAMLVATDALPARDEQLARLECWITRTIGDRDDPAQQQLLHRYAVWHLLRRLRHRNGGADTTHSQLATIRQQLRAAIVLLDWLTAHDLTLQTAGQGDLEAWLAGEQASHRLEAGHFVRWANAQKLTSLDFPATRWGGPTGVIDTQTRWQQARWLLHDTTLDPEDRVAGLLVLLYAQWPSAVSRLTLDHVHASDDGAVRLRLGREPVVLPEPLTGLVLELVASRRGHAALGDQGTSRWLFPGGQPGRPLSAEQLGERLRRLGLRPGQARSTALFQLATDLPAAILARMLGIHIAVAVAWQRASSGDWAAYAAEVSRRGKKGGLLPMTFQDHLQQVATEAVTSIPATAARDAYVVSFLVYDEDDDPRRPTLTIGYNTETRVQQVLAAQPGSELLPADAPTDEAEARWNYAFWLQNELAVIGDSTHDPVGAQLRDQWIKDSGLWFDEPEAAPTDAPDAWDAVEPMAQQITQRFVRACVQLANQLHADGLIQQIFGRPVPVLVHEVEYYDAIADQAEAANPPGVAADFVTWVRNL
jgi:hypothetical protein